MFRLQLKKVYIHGGAKFALPVNPLEDVKVSKTL